MTEYYKHKYALFIQKEEPTKKILSQICKAEMDLKIETFIKTQLGGGLTQILTGSVGNE